MSSDSQLQIRDLWYPQAAATGVSVSRGRLAETNVLLVHAPPPMLTVEVSSEDGCFMLKTCLKQPIVPLHV